MATEPVNYLTYVEAVVHHVELMRAVGETRLGIFDRALLESTLARPRHAATLENADLPAQAATLCYELIENHPWVGGNKRTATHPTDHFLRLNGYEIIARTAEVVEMVNAIESGDMDLARLTAWMNKHVREAR